MSKKKKVKYLKVITPWAVTLPRKTKKDVKYSLSMNQYRNWDFRVSNNIKKGFKELMKDQLENVELVTPVKVRIQVYKPTNRRMDKGNFYAVGSKFLYDAMTEYGVWEDDNDDFVKQELILPTKLDKGKGRMEFEFKTIEE